MSGGVCHTLPLPRLFGLEIKPFLAHQRPRVHAASPRARRLPLRRGAVRKVFCSRPKNNRNPNAVHTVKNVKRHSGVSGAACGGRVLADGAAEAASALARQAAGRPHDVEQLLLLDVVTQVVVV